MSVSLFVYGTLRDPALVLSLTGRRLPARSATLEDFARGVSPAGHHYVLPRTGAHVAGLLLDGLDPDTLARLDAYEDEGRLYFRRPVEVVVEGRTVACEAYVGNPAALGVAG